MRNQESTPKEPSELVSRKHVAYDVAQIPKLIRTHEKINDNKNQNEIIIDDMFAF